MPQCSWSVKRVMELMLALVASAGLLWLAPSGAQAQNTNSGTIVGQVVDAQGAAIQGAVIVLTNTATNAAQPTVSNNAGRYTFVNLQPGIYTVDVKKDGFKEAILKSQNVEVGKQLTLNVPMQVGSATQTVEVTASGAELQTLNATVGETVSGDAIMKLPALSRDANSLTNLQPNTAMDGGVAGADSDQNTFSLDGGSNSDDMDGNHADYTGTQGGSTSGVIPAPAESIEQFSVGVINQTADVNSAAGSSVSMVTKRGTDTMHGSAYEYYLGSYLAANDWGNNQQNIAKGKSHQNRFGATLGGEIIPNWLGGKTYLFGNFEGRRFPNSAVYNHAVPTALFRAGVVQANNTNGWEAYNLNPTSVTVGGTTYAPAVCNLPSGGTGACDPRGLGLDPVVSALWTKFMPLPNTTTGGDKHNTLNYTANVNVPLKSNFFVTRMDHDFGAKNHLSATYHFFSYNPVTTNQVDIGGALPGDTFGSPTATTQRPQLPSMTTVGLTSSLTSNTTNSFHYSYLRNFWQWTGTTTSPQNIPGFPGLGGALEIGGESTTSALIPYNVNTQSVRTRFWDGIGHTFSDDMSVIHGNHLFQFGGKYIHQWDYHQRNDNGGGIMAANVYQSASSQNVSNSYIPTDFTASTSGYKQVYNEALGIITQPQTLYTRAGQQLNLQPLGTPMFDQSYIPLYNVYFTDAWHIRPSMTLSYGAGYTIEMPPHEALGKQVELVDGAGNLISTSDFLAATQRAALGGQDFNPELGFATVANVGGGLKYPYRPFYGGLSPRISLAWNPNISNGLMGWMFGGNKSVVRGGWARIFGRLNGVDLVLVPLLGTGLGQPVACLGASMAGTCNGVGNVDPTNAFRIGPTSAGYDGMVAPLGAAPSATLAQPYFPGEIQNGAINSAAGSGEVLDPNFRPNRSDEFDLTFQRQISPNFSTEIGYTGRVIRNEYQAFNLDSTPYMMTAGGQQFQKAFAGLWQQIAAGSAITPQPFFEAALGGAGSPFCTGAASCTAQVAAKYGPNGKDFIDPTIGNDVYSLWTALNSQAGSWALGRTFPSAATTCSTPGVGACPASGVISGSGQLQAIFTNASLGYGNYNSLFWTVSMRNWRGLTAVSNFTWSRAMGTGQVDQATSSFTVTDPYNLHAMYGPQFNDVPLNYNVYFLYEPGSKTQHGLIGHLAHGWSFAPVLTWHIVGTNAGWTDVNIGSDCASFGESDCNAGSTQETAIKTTGYSQPGGIVRNFVPVKNSNVGTDADPANGGTGLEQFANPDKVLAQFRPMVLGLDTTGQSGLIPGFSQTNVDFAVTKDLAISEKFSTQLNAQATNVFNHFASAAETYDIQNPASFGVISGNALSPRTVEVGLAIRW